MVTFCLWPEYTCPSLAYVLSLNRSCGSFKSKSKGFGPSWTTLYAQCTHVQLSVLYGTTYVILSELECSRQEAWHTLCLEQLCCCTVAPYSSLCTLAHSQLFVLSWRTNRARLAPKMVLIWAWYSNFIEASGARTLFRPVIWLSVHQYCDL